MVVFCAADFAAVAVFCPADFAVAVAFCAAGFRAVVVVAFCPADFAAVAVFCPADFAAVVVFCAADFAAVAVFCPADFAVAVAFCPPSSVRLRPSPYCLVGFVSVAVARRCAGFSFAVPVRRAWWTSAVYGCPASWSSSHSRSLPLLARVEKSVQGGTEGG